MGHEFPLASSRHYLFAVCTVVNFWWWTERPSETCRLFFISVFNQLDAQNLFHNKFYLMLLHVSSTCAHHQEVKIALHSLWYHHTYRYDDTRGCVMQFWPPDDEHMCSKHVEAWNKTYFKTNFVHHLVKYWDKHTEMHGQQNVKRCRVLMQNKIKNKFENWCL